MSIDLTESSQPKLFGNGGGLSIRGELQLAGDRQTSRRNLAWGRTSGKNYGKGPQTAKTPQCQWKSGIKLRRISWHHFERPRLCWLVVGFGLVCSCATHLDKIVHATSHRTVGKTSFHHGTKFRCEQIRMHSWFKNSKVGNILADIGCILPHCAMVSD